MKMIHCLYDCVVATILVGLSFSFNLIVQLSIVVAKKCHLYHDQQNAIDHHLIFSFLFIIFQFLKISTFPKRRRENKMEYSKVEIQIQEIGSFFKTHKLLILKAQPFHPQSKQKKNGNKPTNLYCILIR